MKKALTIVVAAAAVIGLSSCSQDDGSARSQEQATAAQQLDGFLKAQPVPTVNWSQLRQNLIELQTAQAETTATTSFFFNQGVEQPVMSCPSIGFPIPATYQLTNPDAVVDLGRETGAVTVGQLESTGVYTGDTSGTYVMCVSPAGEAYAFYWEGFVSTVTGPAKWDGERIVLTGDSSFDFSEGK
jgi:hypothetical protein